MKMAKKRKKKKQVVDCCAPMRSENESKSMRVRKIDNGYIVSEDTSGPDGYKSKERYTPTKPKIEMQIKEAKAREKRLEKVKL